MIKSVVSGVFLILLVLGFKGINTISYQLDEDYRSFTEFNTVRANIVDYPVYTYEENGFELSSLGYSWNDYQMLTRWNFCDSEHG